MPKKKSKSTRLSVYVPWPLKEKLKRLAKVKRTNLSLLVRDLLSGVVDNEIAKTAT